MDAIEQPAPVATARLSGDGRPTPGPRARRRVALVGAGYVARFHVEALAALPGVEIAAVCDRDPARAAGLAEACGAVAAGDLEALPGHGIDVAHVLVPPDQHVEVTRRLLRLGMGALVEKPLATDSREARALGELAAERGLALGVNHNVASQPAFRRLLRLVGEGRIGRVEHVQATLAVELPQLAAGDHGHWMFRQPHHVLLEQAVHACALLQLLLGRVERATTTLGRSRRLATGVTFQERWDVAARAARGTAQLHLSFAGELPRFTVVALGSDGTAEVDLLAESLAWRETTPWVDAWDRFLSGRRWGTQLRLAARRGLAAYVRHTLGLGRRDDPFFAGMRESIASFHARLDGGERPDDAERAAETLEWCEAIWAGRQGAGSVLGSPTPGKGGPDRGPHQDEVVLLGGAGVIGRALAARLARDGRPVTVTGRRGVGRAAVAAHEDAPPRCLAAALDDAKSLQRAIAGARVVVHLATGGGETWEEVERRMVQGSVAAAEAALAAGVERFVYVSSIAALYVPDAAGREVRDDHPLDPRPEARDLYSRGKVETERALRRLHLERGLPLVVVRPGIVLGGGAPLQHAGLGLWVRDAHCIGWGRGDHSLPLVTVGDVADALAAVVARPGKDLEGRTLNLCSRAPLSAAEVVAAFAAATGRALRFHPRPLAVSQVAEVGKWLLKRAGGRRAPFPSYRDLAAREMRAAFASETARELLGWRPIEQREAFLRAIFAGEGERVA
jgi:predicted dehydrogenase/nucleoside-diphosphate-sugar epimerase